MLSRLEDLRTIGRDLDFRGIKTFLIECQADILVVEGGYQSPPAVMPVTLHYTRSDIERLMRESQQRNDHISLVKNFLSLADILWAIATYISSKQGRLLTVSNTASLPTVPILTLEYETSEHSRMAEELRGSAIYELYINIYKLRGASHEPNRYSRFSHLSEGNSVPH